MVVKHYTLNAMAQNSIRNCASKPINDSRQHCCSHVSPHHNADMQDNQKTIQKSQTHKWGLRAQLLPDMVQINCWTPLLVAVCLQHCQPTRSHVHSFIYPQCCALCMHSPTKKLNVRMVTAFMKLQTETTLSCTRNAHTRASITWQCVDTCPRHKMCKTVSMRQKHSRMNKHPARRKMECRQCVHKASALANHKWRLWTLRMQSSCIATERERKRNQSTRTWHMLGAILQEKTWVAAWTGANVNVHQAHMENASIHKANRNTSTSIHITNTHACKNQPKLHADAVFSRDNQWCAMCT